MRWTKPIARQPFCLSACGCFLFCKLVHLFFPEEFFSFSYHSWFLIRMIRFFNWFCLFVSFIFYIIFSYRSKNILFRNISSISEIETIGSSLAQKHRQKKKPSNYCSIFNKIIHQLLLNDFSAVILLLLFHFMIL